MRGLRWSSLAATAATVLFCASVAGGVGTIVTTCAVIDAGAADAQGVVTIDECAPEATPPAKPPLGTIPPQGANGGPLPEKPSTGNGSDGAVTLDSTQSLPGGTYNYTDFTVENGSVITYDDAVTIRATGSVRIAGRLETSVILGQIEIIAGDEIVIYDMGSTPVTGIETGGLHVTLEADRVDIGVQMVPMDGVTPTHAAELVGSEFFIRSHGTTSGLNGVDIANSILDTTGSFMEIQSSTHISLDSTILDAVRTLVQAFGGDIDFDQTSSNTFGRMLIEASEDVVLQNSPITVLAADLRVEAFGGDVEIAGNRVYAADGLAFGGPEGDGEVVVAASGSVVVSDYGAIVSEGAGGVRVSAHSGSVELDNDADRLEARVECIRAGGILVESAQNVRVWGASFCRAQDGDVVVRAFGGEVLLDGVPYLESVNSDVDVGASGRIAAVQGTGFPEVVIVGPRPQVFGNAVSLVAGSAGIDLQATINASSGDLLMHCEGDISFAGDAEAGNAGDVTMISEGGDILVVDAMITTLSSDIDSGGILLESFGGSGALIDATNAIIVSGDAIGGTSGDVSLLIHASGTIQSFVLPKTVKVKLNENNPAKSKINAAGFFDTGPERASLAGPATVRIGDLGYTANLEPNTKGTKFQFKSGGARLLIKPNRSGSSRAKFRLTITDDFMGQVPDSGDITIEFETASATGAGTVELERGRYRLGKRRGLLSNPNVFPFKVKQVHKGDGKDVLSILAGLATQGGTPDTAPDVTISVGGVFEATIPGNEFTRKGDVYVARNPPSAPGVSKLQINFLREQVLLKAKGLTLGALPGEGPYNIQIAVGQDSRSVDIRMSPANKRTLKY